MAVTSLMHSGM